MYKALTKQNVKKHTLRIAQNVWTKSDILAFGKLLNSIRFSSEERRKGIDFLNDKFCNMIDVNGGYKITEEQSQFGIEWLRKTVLTKTGKLSESKKLSGFSHFHKKIIENFEKFELVGFYANYNGWRDDAHYTPIYRTISKTGEYFDYALIGDGQWGTVEILETGTITPKLEKVLA